MPRVRIAERPHYRHSHSLVLRVRDINYGGHLGNDSVASLLQDARVHWLRAFGATEADLGDGRTGIILSDLAIRFLAEGRLFDEIAIDSDVDEVTGSTLRMCHRVRRGDATLALAEAGVVAYDYRAHAVATFPPDFLARIRPEAAP